jgi:succinyl-diaminopimelate desuccinylase
MAAGVAGKFNATVDIGIEHLLRAAPPTSMKEPIVESIRRAAKEIYGADAHAVGHGGNTVAQEFRQAGFPCVVYSRLDETLHGPNEYCVIDSMVGDTKVWAYAFLDTK